MSLGSVWGSVKFILCEKQEGAVALACCFDFFFLNDKKHKFSFEYFFQTYNWL